jgi:cytidine deaminase
VIMAGAKGQVKMQKLKELLPNSFGPKSLKNK